MTVDAASRRRTSWTAAELLAVEFPEPRWAVPGLVAEGVNLLAGPPKIGKSWLALGLAIAVATGGKAFGKVSVDAGDVLYLALEDTGRRLQSRLRIVLGGTAAPQRLILSTTCPPIAAGGAEQIDRSLVKHPDTRLTIVDVFTKVRGRVSDGNRYDSDYAAMSEIKALADRRGVAFLVVHHTRKMAATDFLDTVSGTHGVAGAADAVLVLARSRGAAAATLKVTGRDIEEAEHALEFMPDLGAWRLLDGPATDYELSATRRRIVGLLRDCGRMTPKEIADKLADVTEPNARQTCARMVKDNQIETDGDGTYRY